LHALDELVCIGLSGYSNVENTRAGWRVAACGDLAAFMCECLATTDQRIPNGFRKFYSRM